MIHSMTAFARVQVEGPWGSAVCELRSINHRYLEPIVRLPENLQILEGPMRECIRNHVKRGKLECILRYQPGGHPGPDITINMPLAERLCRASETIARLLKNPAPITAMDVLNWPGILQMTEVDLTLVEEEVIKLLEQGLDGLKASRAREGAELKQLFLQRLESMDSEVKKVRKILPDILKQQRERLISRFAEAKIELEPERFAQEILLFAQKIDVSEELERLDAHISEVRHVLQEGGIVGRRLDFLMQELNREANTLGAKSVDISVTHSVVELKVLIEQMREQVQNIE